MTNLDKLTYKLFLESFTTDLFYLQSINLNLESFIDWHVTTGGMSHYYEQALKQLRKEKLNELYRVSK